MIFPTPNPLHIVRVGIAITFIWIGLLILDDPISWAGFIRPWMERFLITSPEQTMVFNGWFDIGIGALLLISWNNWMTWLGALLAALHMVTVLAVAGIDPVTVRDISILAGALALMTWSWPERLWPRRTISPAVNRSSPSG